MPHDHSNGHRCGGPCPACEYGPFTRNAYWTGKLMLARDFVDEQHYTTEKLRHHNQALHGTGVVCGLRVVPHENPACQDRFVCVEPGTAIDCCGHEIIVREKDCLDLWAIPEIQALRTQAPPDAGLHTIEICICYRECETELVPVLYDDCGCADDQCAPNRILESYRLDAKLVPPPGAAPQPPASCKDLWEALGTCPDCDQPDCVVLATIPWHVGDSITDGPVAAGTAVIDNTTRHWLPSTQLLYEVLTCVLDQPGGNGSPGEPGPQGEQGIPGVQGDQGPQGPAGEGLEPDLTRIIALSWKHNTKGNALDEIRNGGGAFPFDRGFGIVITFNNRVNVTQAPLAIDPDHVFQVFTTLPAPQGQPFLLPPVPLRGGVFPVRQIAPQTWETITSPTSDNVAFVFFTDRDGRPGPWTPETIKQLNELRVAFHGDFVVDRNGRAVDVEFARAELPTGDRPTGSPVGIQGGLFESWFWIHGDDRPPTRDLNATPAGELLAVPGMREATVRTLERERSVRPFTDLEDFQARVKPTAAEWKAIRRNIGVLPNPFRMTER